MAIHDVRLPIDIERGAIGGPGFKTSVITLANGAEQRNQDWELLRARWNVGYGIEEFDDMQDIYSFFIERRGRAFGFRFRDWFDYKLEAEPAIAVSGEAAKRQIAKTYDLGGVAPYERNITHPDASTLTVYVNDIATGSYTLESNGVLDFGSDPGSNVKVSGQFDVPVRFDTDQLEMELVAFNAGQTPNISILELRAS